ncbi:MAG: ABC transporter ATP-binding protein, partial [Firmicutes bacterium]|nr:ABC transporter ATP-binding protein [Bacillota bacterium]
GFSNNEIDRFSTASLITRSTNDIQQIQMVVVAMLRLLLYAPIIGAGGIYKVVRTHSHMEWIIILGVAAILLLVTVLMRIALPKFRIMQSLIDNLNLVSREILTGLPVIRAFGREQEEEARFRKANIDLTGTQLFTSRTMVFMGPGMSIIMYGITLLIVWVSARRIDAGTLQIGTMTAFITYSMLIVMSFLMLTALAIMVPRAGVAAERIEEVLRTESSITELPEEQRSRADDSTQKGTVVFEQVAFRYPDSELEVLSDISFTAKPGETTAIIGSTGCGKSTLVNLIPRFYDVTAGRILVGGTDIREMGLKELRDRIGFVPQKGVLFSGTVASNLRFGDEEAGEEEMKQAAATAQALEFIESKPEGLEAPIAQGGTNVSGGQKQRLAIARALIRKPEIMIFDDSFSALDMKTDTALRRALNEELHDSTVIIVAQRISTIIHADQILVLEQGKIAGIGTHEQLLQTCDVYREIASSQLSAAELGIREEV